MCAVKVMREHLIDAVFSCQLCNEGRYCRVVDMYIRSSSVKYLVIWIGSHEHEAFLDTHVSLAPTHVCLSVGWLVTLLDFQSASVSGRPM